MRRGKPENKRAEYGKAVVFAGVLCLMVLLGGCGKKDDDPAGRQVLEISITPEPTPTPVPEQLNPDAVVTEGSLTMVNGYLVEGIGTTRKGKLDTEASEEENPDSGEEDINSEDGTDTNSDEENANSGDKENQNSGKSEDTDSDT